MAFFRFKRTRGRVAVTVAESRWVQGRSRTHDIAHIAVLRPTLVPPGRGERRALGNRLLAEAIAAAEEGVSGCRDAAAEFEANAREVEAEVREVSDWGEGPPPRRAELAGVLRAGRALREILRTVPKRALDDAERRLCPDLAEELKKLSEREGAEAAHAYHAGRRRGLEERLKCDSEVAITVLNQNLRLHMVTSECYWTARDAAEHFKREASKLEKRLEKLQEAKEALGAEPGAEEMPDRRAGGRSRTGAGPSTAG